MDRRRLTFASNYKCVLFNLTKSVLMFVLLSYEIGLIPIYGHIEVSTMNIIGPVRLTRFLSMRS